MENLQNELVTLKTTLDAMAVINANLKNSMDVLTLKLEELQLNNDPIIEVDQMAQLIIGRFEYLLPSTIDFSWSDGGFVAEYEVDTWEMLNNEIGYQWHQQMAEYLCEQLNDLRK